MLLAYYALAVLVILPNTRLLRAALTPVVLAFFGNAILHWDVSGGDPDKYKMNNPTTVCPSSFPAFSSSVSSDKRSSLLSRSYS